MVEQRPDLDPMRDTHPDPRARTEAAIQQQIQLAIGSRPDTRIWRQNAGRWFHVPDPCPRCRPKGRWIAGAPTGAADLSGVHKGRCLQIEVKSATGTQRTEQVRWENMVVSQGGIYLLARSPEEVVKALEAL